MRDTKADPIYILTMSLCGYNIVYAELITESIGRLTLRNVSMEEDAISMKLFKVQRPIVERFVRIGYPFYPEDHGDINVELIQIEFK